MFHTCFNGIEEVGTLLGFLDVGVDEQRVCFGMNVLHHDLEAVEATGLGSLHFTAEALEKVFVDNTIRGSEEGQDVRDEVPLIVGQFVPVVEILGQVDLFRSPERSLRLLVHLPDLHEREDALGHM